MGNMVEFPNMSLGEIAEYVKTPIALTYNEEGEAHNEWKITDAATINACIQAISQITVGRDRASHHGCRGDTCLPDGGWKYVDAGFWRPEICREITLVMRRTDGKKSRISYGIILRRRDCNETTRREEGRNITACGTFADRLWRSREYIGCCNECQRRYWWQEHGKREHDL